VIDEATKEILSYGVLGVAVVVLSLLWWRWDIRLQDRDATIKALLAKHAEDVATLMRKHSDALATSASENIRLQVETNALLQQAMALFRVRT
jgi:hypothetical protein